MLGVYWISAQMLLKRAFDRSVVTSRPVKPWPWADMAPVARIRLPRLGVERVVLDTGSGQAMAFGPTMLPGGAKARQSWCHRDRHPQLYPLPISSMCVSATLSR